MASWSEIKSISQLRITFTTTNQSLYIFGNGENNVQVIVHMVALNEYDQEITGFSNQEAWDNISLIDYITGVPIINNQNQNNWFFLTSSTGRDVLPPQSNYAQDSDEQPASYSTNDPRNYQTPPEPPKSLQWSEINRDDIPRHDAPHNGVNYYTPWGDNTLGDDAKTFQYSPEFPQGCYEDNTPPGNDDYSQVRGTIVGDAAVQSEFMISFFVGRGRTDPARQKDVAVQVTLTHPNPARRVYTTRPDGGAGNNSWVSVHALDAIDYSDSRNVVVGTPAITTIRNNLFWQSRRVVTYSHNNGLLQRHVIQLYPQIGGMFAGAAISPGYSLQDEHLNRDNIDWVGSSLPGFTGIKSDRNFFWQYPFAVIDRGWNYDNYEVNMWYLNPYAFRVDGHYFGFAADFTFKVNTYIDNNDVDWTVGNPATLNMFKFSIPEKNLVSWGWASSPLSPRLIYLEDIYGNSGNLRLSFDYGENFNIPQLI